MSRKHVRIGTREPERMRRLALDRDDWRCTRCESPVDLEVHHVQPLAEGGPALALDNLQTLCADCHMAAHLDPERQTAGGTCMRRGNVNKLPTRRLRLGDVVA